jgi:hypothetical protein
MNEGGRRKEMMMEYAVLNADRAIRPLGQAPYDGRRRQALLAS